MKAESFRIACIVLVSMIAMAGTGCNGTVFRSLLSEADSYLYLALMGRGASGAADPVHVAATGNDVTGDGTGGNPYASPQKAISVARERGASAVLVAEGTYAISDDAGLALEPGISLYGGYDPADWSRHPYRTRTERQDHQTVLAFTGTFTGAAGDPSRAVYANGASITAATVVEGLTITGAASGVRVSAVFCTEGASPTLRCNTIDAGSAGDDQRAYGVYNYNGASPAIENNYISGGTTAGSSAMAYGIFNYNASSPPVRDNEIYGGEAAVTYGIYNYNGSAPAITGNAINGGIAGTTSSYGIYNSASSPSISGNNINGGTGRWAYGIANHSGSNADISHNVIYGGTATGQHAHGVYNNGSTPTIYSNDIDAGSGLLTYGVNNVKSSSLVFNNTIYGGTASGEGCRSFGVFNDWQSVSPLVYNNTIHAGTHTGSANVLSGSYGVHNSGSGTAPKPRIVNNIIFAGMEDKSYGIYLAASNIVPDAVRGNDIFDCAMLFAIQYAPTNIVGLDVAGINALPYAAGNISVDALFTDRAGRDWRLTAPSPAPVKAGGDDLSAIFTDDRLAVSRANWSLGAYEWTGAP